MFLGYNDAAKLPPFCGFECVKTMLRRHSAKDWVFRGFGNGLLLNASCTLSALIFIACLVARSIQQNSILGKLQLDLLTLYTHHEATSLR